MQFLTDLALWHVDVYLPALAALTHQLRHMDVYQCSLRAGGCGATNIFAQRWAKLEELYLDHVTTIDAEISAVDLPSLRDLSLKGVWINVAGAAEGREYECAHSFARGCPQCTQLCFSVPSKLSGNSSAALRSGFSSLKAVDVHWRTRLPRALGWPETTPELVLPAGVTALTCNKISRDGVWEELAEEGLYHLDLYVMLAMAASCIADGVGLRSLSCVHTATYLVRVRLPDASIGFLRPNEDDLTMLFRPVCLCGLTRLSLKGSPYCAQDVIDWVVMCMPDLRDLEVDMSWAPPDPVDENEELQRSRPILCRGPQELTVQWVVRSTREGNEPLDLTLTLNESWSLQQCCIHIRGRVKPGDTVRIVLQCFHGAGIRTTVEYPHLYCTVGMPELGETAPEAQATATFDFGMDKVWEAAVRHSDDGTCWPAHEHVQLPMPDRFAPCS